MGRQEADWQRPKSELPDTVFTASQPPSVSGPSLAPVAQGPGDGLPAQTALHEQALPEIDLDIDLENLAPAHTPSVAPGPPWDLPETGGPTEVAFSADAVLDIRQAADFFVSLGQTERAVQLLKKQISGNAQANPLVYLDLLALCHSLGLIADFSACRAAFARYFNAVVPEFSEFHRDGNDLLAYPDVLAGLVPLWPGAEAVAFLDACIFHNDRSPVATPFDLAAFRDLLMLHAIIEKIANSTGNSALPSAPAKVQSEWEFSAKPAAKAQAGNLAWSIPRAETAEITLVPLDETPLGESIEMLETPLPMLSLDFSAFLDNAGDAAATEPAKKSG
jgi:hypothetical protein